MKQEQTNIHEDLKNISSEIEDMKTTYDAICGQVDTLLMERNKLAINRQRLIGRVQAYRSLLRGEVVFGRVDNNNVLAPESDVGGAGEEVVYPEPLSRQRKKWSPDEEDLVKKLYLEENLDFLEIARRVGRTDGSIYCFVHYNEILKPEHNGHKKLPWGA